jgi:hypothetical protein
MPLICVASRFWEEGASFISAWNTVRGERSVHFRGHKLGLTARYIVLCGNPDTKFHENPSSHLIG